ncbi:MAG: YncE family protein [Candidatus Cyclobacteriaceae bacterium M3_2C_046]
MNQYILIVLHKLNQSFGYYDVQTGKKTASIPTRVFPHECCLSPDRTRLFITEYGLRGVETPGKGGNTVAVFDLKTRKRTSTISTGDYDRPHGIVSWGDKLFVTSESTQKLLIFDIHTEELIYIVDTDALLSHMVNIAPDGKTVYTANVSSGTLSAIDPETGVVIKQIKVKERPEGMAFSPNGKLMYVVNRESKAVSIVDTEAMEEIDSISTGHGPVRIVITPDGKRIAFPLFHSDVVEVADTESRKVIKTIPVGKQPAGTAISPDGKLVFMSCEIENKVYVLSMESLEIIKTIDTENGCDAMVCIYQNEIN